MSRRAAFVLLGVLILLLGSARPGLRFIEAAPVLSESIREISVEPQPDQTVIRVQTGRLPMYTVFELANPPTLVVDLAETALGPYTEGIPVHHGAVKEILPSRIFGRVARLEITLTRPARHTVRAEGKTLLVAVARSPEDEPEDEPQDEENAPRPEPATAPRRQATRLTAVNVDRRDGLRVVMAANGALAPKVFTVVGPPYRVVIDLPGVMNVVKPLIMPVNDPVLRRVRIGQHQQRARVVLDLDEAAPYEVTQDENRLVVRLGHQGKTAKAPSAEPSSPTPPPATAERELPRQLPKMAAATIPAKPARSETQTETRPPKAQIETVPPPTQEPSAAQAPAIEEEIGQEEIGRKRYTGKLISMDFEEADLPDVLRYLGEASGQDLVISEDVSGGVTLKLAAVPWDQALDLVLKTNGLGMQEIAGIRRIAPLATIAKMQEEEAKAMELCLKVGELVTRVIPLAYAKPEAVAGIAKKSLSTRGSIEVDSRTNAIIVKDTAPAAREVADLAKMLDSPTRQVMIEARMVQAVPSFARGLGVQWGGGYASRSGEFNIQAQGLATAPPAFGVFSPNFAVNLPASPTVGAIGAVTVGRLAGGTLTLDLRLSAGETQGLTKIVSAPRIMVLDNMEAKISQGESIPFQTTSLQGTNIQFFEAALTLSVTPHVTSDDTILLKIMATKNAPGDVVPGVGTRILKKEANTQVLVKDGETLVIGGIFETSKTSAETRVPLLHRIPILGWLFKSRTETENISELLVFVTPRIVR